MTSAPSGILVADAGSMLRMRPSSIRIMDFSRRLSELPSNRRPAISQAILEAVFSGVEVLVPAFCAKPTVVRIIPKSTPAESVGFIAGVGPRLLQDIPRNQLALAFDSGRTHLNTQQT